MGEKTSVTLGELRSAIDQVDDRIHDLLMQRAELVLQVGDLKGRAREGIFYRPEREAQIHRRLEQRHHGPLPVTALHRIYREIISASLNLEKQISIVYLGVEGSFTHQAALKHFGTAFQMFPSPAIDDVFHEVEVGRVEFGVVPVENSTEGMMIHTLDRFVDSPLKICSEIHLPVVYNLLSQEAELGAITEIFCQPQALTQCRAWLSRHLPRARIETVESASRAMALAQAQGGRGVIAGVYHCGSQAFNILAEHLEEDSDNENRFLVIGKQTPTPSGQDKTSMLFSFRDRTGFLHHILAVFATRGINLTRIESRPSRRKPWDYIFFVDFEGHQEDPGTASALAELAQTPGVFIKLLGSYPYRAL